MTSQTHEDRKHGKYFLLSAVSFSMQLLVGSCLSSFPAGCYLGNAPLPLAQG